MVYGQLNTGDNKQWHSNYKRLVKTLSKLASFPGPRAAFGCTKERGGPGMFPHVCDVEGRKVVERT